MFIQGMICRLKKTNQLFLATLVALNFTLSVRRCWLWGEFQISIAFSFTILFLHHQIFRDNSSFNVYLFVNFSFLEQDISQDSIKQRLNLISYICAPIVIYKQFQKGK